MFRNLMLIPIALVVILPISHEETRTKRTRNRLENPDRSIWKKEYEDELNRAMLSTRKRDNHTRVTQSTGTPDNEAVIEKIMESITSGEKYLKKIDNIAFQLNRLDIEVHEKTNSILKYLGTLSKSVKSQVSTDKLEATMEVLKTDMNYIRVKLDKTPFGKTSDITQVVSGDYRMETNLDNRLKLLENHMKTILTSVESITGIISEVKHRQISRPHHKQDIGASLDALTLIGEFRRALHEQKSKNCEYKVGRTDRGERYPTDCHEIQIQGFNISGIYKIKPDEMEPFYVLCDLSTAGGGWTVFQNRFDGSQEFYKSWMEYKHGFGNLASEFWLGLEKLHYLTNQKLYELRIEVETNQGHDAYASYSVFTIASEHEGYRISTLGSYHGSAGDSMSYHAGQKFSSPDVDNDEWKDGSCATEHGGAWWYKACDKSNLNGKYTLTPEDSNGQSIYWISFKGPNVPLTKTRMMIRPLPASRPLDFNEHTRKSLGGPQVRTQEEHPKTFHVKESKPGFDPTQPRKPYRYEVLGPEAQFFPNYA